MIKFILSLFKRNPIWKYGHLKSGGKARQNIITGEIEFVLWKAGEQGHVKDFWHKAGDGHEIFFSKPNTQKDKEAGE